MRMHTSDPFAQHPCRLPPIRYCGTCSTRGQLTYRSAGWVVLCPCPVCPAPAAPDHAYNPTDMAAIRYWNWLQGGPR
jgi:hypothetical protein